MKYFNFSDNWKFGITRDGVKVLTPSEPNDREYDPLLDLKAESEIKIENSKTKFRDVSYFNSLSSDNEPQKRYSFGANKSGDTSLISLEAVTSSTFVKLDEVANSDDSALVTLSFTMPDVNAKAKYGNKILRGICDCKGCVHYAAIIHSDNMIHFGKFSYEKEDLEPDFHDARIPYTLYLTFYGWRVRFRDGIVQRTFHRYNFDRKFLLWDVKAYLD